MKYLITSFFLFYGYAIVRYHFGKGLDQTFFFFVVNKAIAWSATFYLGMSVLLLPKKFPSKKQFGLSSFALGLIHIILTLYLAILNYYPDFYNKGQISVLGFSVLMSGLLSISLMTMAFLASLFSSKFPKVWLHYGFFAFLVNSCRNSKLVFSSFVANVFASNYTLGKSTQWDYILFEMETKKGRKKLSPLILFNGFN
jgi:hypothetical protein